MGFCKYLIDRNMPLEIDHKKKDSDGHLQDICFVSYNE